MRFSSLLLVWFAFCGAVSAQEGPDVSREERAAYFPVMETHLSGKRMVYRMPPCRKILNIERVNSNMPGITSRPMREGEKPEVITATSGGYLLIIREQPCQ